VCLNISLIVKMLVFPEQPQQYRELVVVESSGWFWLREWRGDWNTDCKVIVTCTWGRLSTGWFIFYIRTLYQLTWAFSAQLRTDPTLGRKFPLIYILPPLYVGKLTNEGAHYSPGMIFQINLIKLSNSLLRNVLEQLNCLYIIAILWILIPADHSFVIYHFGAS
jgi:hypothetical protein